MTIFTGGKVSDKKEDEEFLNPVVVTAPDTTKKKDEAAISIVALTPKSRPVSQLASLCILFTALVVFAIGILGGIYMYNRLMHKKYESWCGVSYYEQQLEGYEPAEPIHYPNSPDGYHDNQQYYSLHGEFEEHVEIDKELGEYEKIEVPQFADVKQATILHDFDKNLTAVVDKENMHCFIIPLNRTTVKPPRDFWDLLTKLRSGYYLPDTQVVREKYRVITPRIENMAPLGFYIWKECRDLDTYRMVKEGEPVALSRKKKRAAFDCSSMRSNHYSLGASGTSILRNIEIVDCI